MASETPNMGLTAWGPNDYFNDLDLKRNWEKVDAHDHDPTNDGGVRINSGGIANDAVTTAKLDDRAVTNEKIDNGTITLAKLAADLVNALEKAALALSRDTVFGTAATANVGGLYQNLKIKTGSIVNSDISAAAKISSTKLDITTRSGTPLSNLNPIIDGNAVAGGDLTGKFSSLQLQPNSVGPSEIALDAVGPAELAENSVTARAIKAGEVGNDEIGQWAVGPDEIYPYSVSEAQTNQYEAWTVYNVTPAAVSGNWPVVGVGENPDQNTEISTKWRKIHKTTFVQIVMKCGGYGFGVGAPSIGWVFNLPTASTTVALGTWSLRARPSNGNSNGFDDKYYGGPVICPDPFDAAARFQMVFYDPANAGAAYIDPKTGGVPAGGSSGFLGSDHPSSLDGYWYTGTLFSANLMFED